MGDGMAVHAHAWVDGVIGARPLCQRWAQQHQEATGPHGASGGAERVGVEATMRVEHQRITFTAKPAAGARERDALDPVGRNLTDPAHG